MRSKALAFMSLLALALIATPALGSYTVIPLGQYNISLDFGDKVVTVEPEPTSSDLYSIYHAVLFHGNASNDWGAIYLYEYQGDRQMLDAHDRMWMLMKSYCTMPDVDEGTVAGLGGYLAKGTARVAHGFGHQICYGGLATLPGSAVGRRDFALIGHFTDEALNENFVKTARVEYAGQILKL